MGDKLFRDTGFTVSLRNIYSLIDATSIRVVASVPYTPQQMMQYFCEPNRRLHAALQAIHVNTAREARSVTWDDDDLPGTLYNDWQKCVARFARMAIYLLTGRRNRLGTVRNVLTFNLDIEVGVLHVKIRGLFPSHTNLFANGGVGEEVRRMVMIGTSTYLVELEWTRNEVSH